MNIRDAYIKWNDDLLNSPDLHVLVDDHPDRDELRFENKGQIWYAETEGYAQYFAWSGEGNDGGYTGDHYEITTVEGDDVTLKGPWSSRAGVVNNLEFGPVIDVHLTTSERTFERGYTFRGESITVEKAQEALEYVGDVELEETLQFSSDEPYWIPQRIDDVEEDHTEASA